MPVVLSRAMETRSHGEEHISGLRVSATPWPVEKRSTRAKRQLCALGAAVVLTAACAMPQPPLVRQQCYNPDAQLAAVLKAYEAVRAEGCNVDNVQRRAECDRLRREIARLAVVCSTHAPTLMANAVIAYEEGQPAESQQLLDQILAQPRRNPDAAALRARIAIEEGNVPFARRLLEQQIKLAPDHAGLHETYAAALYLDGRLPDAREELRIAGSLGAPRWRIAYHLGLIEELSGRADEAGRLYAEALTGNPGWAPAESRLKALRARDGEPATPPR
jgi:predicted Zn-dependent protease